MVLQGSTQYPNNELCKFLKEVAVQSPTQCGLVLELWCLASPVESRSLKARKSYQHSVLTPGALQAYLYTPAETSSLPWGMIKVMYYMTLVQCPQ